MCFSLVLCMYCFELQRWTENAVCNILLPIKHFYCTKYLHYVLTSLHSKYALFLFPLLFAVNRLHCTVCSWPSWRFTLVSVTRGLAGRT